MVKNAVIAWTEGTYNYIIGLKGGSRLRRTSGSEQLKIRSNVPRLLRTAEAQPLT